MKLAKEQLKDLIKEVMTQTQPDNQEQASAEEAPNAQELKQKLIDLSKTMTGIRENEVEMVNFFIQLIDLAKRENIAVGELQRRVGLVKQAAEKVAK